MPNSWLLDTNYNGGLQETHYFDGRLLTADALKADQDAVQTRLNWLGNAAGAGVIHGLVVSKVQTGGTKIAITQGLGVNFAGRILQLPGDMSLDLGMKATPAVPTARQSLQKARTFASQSNPAPQSAGSNGTGSAGSAGGIPEGVFLLTMLPAPIFFNGLAPMRSSVSGVSTGITNAPGCGSEWEVDGVQFKIIRLDTSDLSGLFKNVKDISVDPNGNLRRNLLAHWCYGTLIVRDFGIHPFDFTDLYDPLDPDASNIPDLSADDLPLAAFHWDGSQITFVDQWVARRRVTHPAALLGTNSFQQVGTWKAIMDDRRVADNQARFRQFQDQLDSIVAAGNAPGSGTGLTQVKVTDYFTFLPPVGFLPVTQHSLKTLLCGPEDQRHDRGTEKESEHWRYGFQFNMSEDTIRMLGLFAGVTIGAVLDTMFPAVTVVGAPIGIVGKALGGISGLFHSGASMANLATQNASVIESLTQRINALEVAQQQPSIQAETAVAQRTEPTPPEPPNRELTIGASIQGESEKETVRTGPEELSMRFHKRICNTVSQPRIKLDGKTRSETEGFELATFFDGYVLRISLIGKDRVDLLMNESWYEDAIDMRPDRHPDPPVTHTGASAYPVDEGLHKMPLIFDIYLVEENLLDRTQPLYIIFHKALHPVELIHFVKPQEQSSLDQTPGDVAIPPAQ